MTKPASTNLPKEPHLALMEQIETALPLIEALGLGDPNALAGVKQAKADLQRHLASLDYFTRVYAPRGWTPFDQLAVTLLDQVAVLQTAQGEQTLVDHFLDPQQLHLVDLRVRRPAYVPWRGMIERAFERLGAKDYLSAVPLLLIVVDGLCQHHLQKSAFGGAADDAVFDSLTSAPNGLAHSLALAGRTRKKLSSEALDIPYRNGILHGRDPDYGHAIVAAKSVNLFRATVDYIDKRMDEEERIVKAAKDQQPPDWQAMFAAQEHTRQLTAAIDSWEPRAPREGVIATNENACGIQEGSPEAVAVAFLKAMARKNFGKLAEFTLDFTRRAANKWAGDLRRDYGDLELERWSLGWINDTAAASTEMSATVSGQWRGQPWSGQVGLRLLYVDEQCDSLPRGLAGGRWVVSPYALGEMWRLAAATLRKPAA